MASRTIATLAVQIQAKTAAFVKGLSDAVKQLNRFKRATKGGGKGGFFDRFRDFARNQSRMRRSLGFLVGAQVLGGLSSFAAKMNTMADATQGFLDEVAAGNKSMDQFGKSMFMQIPIVGELVKGFKNFGQSMADALAMAPKGSILGHLRGDIEFITGQKLGVSTAFTNKLHDRIASFGERARERLADATPNRNKAQELADELNTTTRLRALDKERWKETHAFLNAQEQLLASGEANAEQIQETLDGINKSFDAQEKAIKADAFKNMGKIFKEWGKDIIPVVEKTKELVNAAADMGSRGAAGVRKWAKESAEALKRAKETASAALVSRVQSLAQQNFNAPTTTSLGAAQFAVAKTRGGSGQSLEKLLVTANQQLTEERKAAEHLKTMADKFVEQNNVVVNF